MSKLKKVTVVCLALVMIAGLFSGLASATDALERSEKSNNFNGGYDIIDNGQETTRGFDGVWSSQGYQVGLWDSGVSGSEVYSVLASCRNLFPNVSTIKTSVQNGKGETDSTGFIHNGTTPYTYASSSAKRTLFGTHYTWWDYRPTG